MSHPTDGVIDYYDGKIVYTCKMKTNQYPPYSKGTFLSLPAKNWIEQKVKGRWSYICFSMYVHIIEQPIASTELIFELLLIRFHVCFNYSFFFNVFSALFENMKNNQA